jgi:ubiquinone/menaquinone biosynthesis C-methylase UbiE
MSDPRERLRAFWDLDAATYDRSPSHALSDPREAVAWRDALSRHLPSPGARILDAGAGAGALSLLAAELGHRVTALDFSERMLELARAKAADRGLEIEFVVADVTEPPPGPFDAVIERHVLWTQPDPVAVLAAWRRVTPEGRLVAYEALHGRGSMIRRVRDDLAERLKTARGVPRDHHAGYDADVLERLPLAGAGSVRPFAEALGAGGWRRWRAERMREVERVRLSVGPPLVAWLEAVPRFALLAE